MRAPFIVDVVFYEAEGLVRHTQLEVVRVRAAVGALPAIRTRDSRLAEAANLVAARPILPTVHLST